MSTRLIEVVEATEGVRLLEVRDEVLEMHQGGKIAIRSRYDISDLSTLRRVYTPGVAEVSLKIRDDPSLARRYTSIRHLVAIVTDGTAVLGLGDIGPKAAMPVMEGKASLLETLTGLSGMPILLDTKDPDEIVETVVHMAPTFAAIQLEDISAPRCFAIEERIQARLDIPVMHDDQHGTAVVVTAALLNAAKVTGRDLAGSSIGVIGLGAAGLALAKMLMFRFGHPVLGADIVPEAVGRLTKAGGIASDLKGIMAGCDVVIATTGAPGLIEERLVRQGQIILALSNPTPEIEPERALARRRGLRGGREIGQQRPRLPRDLPRRRGRQCPAHHAGDAHRRGRNDRGVRQSGRDRPEPARQGAAQGGRPGGGPRGPGPGAQPGRPDRLLRLTEEGGS